MSNPRRTAYRLSRIMAPVAVVLAAAPVFAQGLALTLPATPVGAGTTVVASATNSSGRAVAITGTPIRWLRSTGELARGALLDASGVGDVWGAGQARTIRINVPSSGVGSSGSFVLRMGVAAFPSEVVGVGRLDIGAADPGFSSIHMYPANVGLDGASHWLAPSSATQWEIANTGSAYHTFGAADTVQLFEPGASVPIATTPLMGIGVAAGGVTRIALPLVSSGGLSVRARWVDPSIGLTSAEHGVLVAPRPMADLQLPEGRDVPRGGGIRARLIVRPHTSPAFTQPLLYVAGLCSQPGSTAIGGVRIPLALDTVLQGSLDNGLGGVLSNHIGLTTTVQLAHNHTVVGYDLANGVGITHPNLAIVSGLELRFAALAYDTVADRFLVSQPETIRFQ